MQRLMRGDAVHEHDQWHAGDIAARSAKLLLAGAVVNASAVARALAESGLDVTLLCAGTNGQIAMEDVSVPERCSTLRWGGGEVEFESDAGPHGGRCFAARG